MLIPVSEHSLPVIPAKKKLKILFSFNGILREAFWIKYTKKGDFLASSSVKSNRKLKGNARVSGNELCIKNIIDITSESIGANAHNYLTLHPSNEAMGHADPVVNGLGGFSGTSFDLGRMVETKEIMVVLLTKPELYPYSFSKDNDVRFGDVYQGFYVPEFHIHATAMKDYVTTDYAVPFVKDHSADFIMETNNFDYKHILIQMRLVYRFGGFHSKNHVFLIPTPEDDALQPETGIPTTSTGDT